jgi:hypothetical protein
VVYNTQISPTAGYAIKGTLYYQGEANAKETDDYYWKMTALVQGWRNNWGQGNFPFYYVQLPSFSGNTNWAPFREAQRRALDIPNSGMVVTTDVGESQWEHPYNLHPRNKYDIGRRLALWALANDYGETNRVYSGPLFQSAVEDSGNVILTFDHVGSGLQAALKPLDTSLAPDPPFSSYDPPVPVADLVGFEVAGSNDQWYEADASIQGTTIVLNAPRSVSTDAGTLQLHEHYGRRHVLQFGKPPGRTFLEDVTTPASAPAVPNNLTATAGIAPSRTQLGCLGRVHRLQGETLNHPERALHRDCPPIGNAYTDTSATSSIPYYYVVSAVNGIGESADSSEANATPEVPTQVPPAPSGFQASAGNARVDLSWDAAATAAGYNVKRSFSQGGPYTPIATPTSTSYADTSVANGTTYYYVVSASNIIGEGDDSSEQNATPEEPVAPPDTPTGLGATPGDGQVDLSWDVSPLASSYNVKRSTSEGGSYATIASPTTNSYTDTTAVNNTTYYYVVSAVNVSGQSGDSSEVSATPFAPVPPRSQRV